MSHHREMREAHKSGSGAVFSLQPEPPVTASEEGGEMPPDSYHGGTKNDDGKSPLSLIPLAALEEEARVLAFGAAKYGKSNWKRGFEYSRLLDAALRHIYAYAAGQDRDPESGLNHLAHARATLGFLLHFEAVKGGRDDRA